jgi:hypothetical protein
MIETLIVIATHGGADLLRQSLPRMTGWPVLVVETGVQTAAVMDEVAKYENVAYLHTPYRGYDTGAYLWAYWHVEAKNYLFLQDSVCPTQDTFVDQFYAALGKNTTGVVGWSSFSMRIWDSQEQAMATEWMYGEHTEWPPKGIFGPIFFATRTALDTLRDKGLLPMPPVHKEQQQAMERVWAILFHRAGVRIDFLVHEDAPRAAEMESGQYPALRKVFKVRS